MSNPKDLKTKTDETLAAIMLLLKQVKDTAFNTTINIVLTDEAILRSLENIKEKLEELV